MCRIRFFCEHLNILAILLVVFGEENIVKEEFICPTEMSLFKSALSVIIINPGRKAWSIVYLI